jgi:hypothetical protein
MSAGRAIFQGLLKPKVNPEQETSNEYSNIEADHLIGSKLKMWAREATLSENQSGSIKEKLISKAESVGREVQIGQDRPPLPSKTTHLQLKH